MTNEAARYDFMYQRLFCASGSGEGFAAFEALQMASRANLDMSPLGSGNAVLYRDERLLKFSQR